MNVLRKLTLRDLKLNKKRTIGTLVGIILSCALIIVVLGSFYSLFHSLLKLQINNDGYYHLRVNNIKEDDINNFKSKDYVKEVIVTNNVGHVYNKRYDGFDGRLYSLDKKTFDDLSYHILEGDFPKNENEILINRSFKYNYNLKPGDYFDFDIVDVDNPNNLYESNIIESNTKNYKIVGVVDKYDDLITVNTSSKSYDAYIVLKNPKNYKTNIPNLLGANIFKKETVKYDSFSVNTELILLETLDFSNQVMRILYTIIGIVLFIIMVTSVFSIRNSFAISISEKMKTYGMLSSVGATKRQIIGMVIFEGLVIGCIGVVLGILLGLLVNVLLIQIINMIANNANLFTDGFKFVYKFTWTPITMSIILSFIVILISSLTCAIKASRVSPIQNIRNSDNIKRKKIKCPSIIRKIFGIGGVLSYKNLKRSKKKYRVTVVSLTISIFIFILVSTFVEYTLNIIHEEYTNLDYNIYASLSSNDYYDRSENYEDYIKRFREKQRTKLKEIENLDKAYVKYHVSYEDGAIDFENHIISNEIIDYYGDYKYISYEVLLYNDNGFKDYINKLGLNYDEVKDKLIVIDEKKDRTSDKRNEYYKLTDYKKGDYITIKNHKMEVALTTEKGPMGEGNGASWGIVLVGNYENYPIKDDNIYVSSIYFNSKEPYKLAKTLKDLSDDDIRLEVDNLDEAASQTRSVMLIVSIIVYGFILVVTFIGVTSVFNTINSNMELRKRDFASLKSIGMTRKEFNNMINLEAVFYSFKSLVYGIVLGLIGSYGIFALFTRDYSFEYRLPIKSILIAILFIIVIVLIIMRYSIKKINKQNIIETIRNSNI